MYVCTPVDVYIHTHGTVNLMLSFDLKRVLNCIDSNLTAKQVWTLTEVCRRTTKLTNLVNYCKHIHLQGFCGLTQRTHIINLSSLNISLKITSTLRINM